MAEQAVAGLQVAKSSGVVRVRDGQDTWLARRHHFEAALDRLAKRPADESDEGGAEAYGALCRGVAGPVVTLIGTPRGAERARRMLVRAAVDQGLLDADEAGRFA